MAKARPPNECVSRWTRALTLFHLPSATAFTIRAWSRRTVRQTFSHSMECQSGVPPGAAPAGISAADISACLPESVGRGSLVTEHPREVSPLSRRGNVVRGRTHPLSGRLPAGVRFLPHPFPAVSSAPFAVGLPSRGGDGVTSFISSITPGEGRAFRPGARHPGRGTLQPPPLATYLLVRA